MFRMSVLARGVVALVIFILAATTQAEAFGGRRGTSSTPASAHFKTLGLSPTASTDEVRSAYKKLAREYHPDRNKDPKAHDKFLRISEAHEVLMDPRQRREAEANENFGRGNNYRGNTQFHHFHQQQHRAQQHWQRQQQRYHQQFHQQQQWRASQPPLMLLLEDLLANLPVLVLVFVAAYLFLTQQFDPQPNRGGGGGGNGRNSSRGAQSRAGATQSKTSQWHLRRADLTYPNKPFVVVVITREPLVTESGSATRVSRWIATLNARHRNDKVYFRGISQQTMGKARLMQWEAFVEAKTPWSASSPTSSSSETRSASQEKNDAEEVSAVVVLRPSQKKMARLRAPVSPDNFALLTSFVERLLDGQTQWVTVESTGSGSWPEVPT
ncbi:DnaJ family protein [Hondaea fermentalgiana]|uniref:DnaJ family protein n=1 Tax=Hondaea fermentalgiana TaxID=2315210 RepID=A0A2R5GSA4_9STRA|nr:DnaJ family protein [Hondaea fermentalgiana]|eukprot:GBG31241.1 DnaJ family protein [Hondaea fermentalgiana]